MKVTINKSRAVGSISAPPSKSMAHRLLISAALCGEECVISNIDLSEDIKATLFGLEALGVKISSEGDRVTLSGGFNPMEGATINCRESGSTLRFLIPICLLFGRRITLTGSPRLFERPLGIYEEIAKKQGFLFERGENKLTLCGRLKAGEYSLEGGVSSQFISGLLFALSKPEQPSKIRLSTDLKSAPYVDMTVSSLNMFGARISKAPDGFDISPSPFHPLNAAVEGDWSNAAFLEGFNLIGGEVSVEGLSEESLQGDRIYRSYYREIEKGNPTLDISDCPDLGPVLIALSALLGGATLLGTDRLRIKESDRGEAMKAELQKMGMDIELGADFIKIPSTPLKAPTEPLYSHNDHRIAMALSIILSRLGGSILEAQAVNKSYPQFFSAISSLGIEVKTDE